MFKTFMLLMMMRCIINLSIGKKLSKHLLIKIWAQKQLNGELEVS